MIALKELLSVFDYHCPHLCQRGLKIALVDADIGQSFLGPPATIGLSVFKSDPNWQLILSVMKR
jgi:polynucleotide 5'-kinase involved in rRNA processing